MRSIQRHPNSSKRAFLKRTVSAQLHLFGWIAAIAGLAVLLHVVQAKDRPAHVIACLIFGLTSIFVFAVSTTYHFMHDGFVISPKLELRLEDLDHFAIFLFIAGTYTPFLLNVIAPPWRGILLTLIWGVGFAGIIYTHVRPRLPAWAQHRFVYTSLFLVMGWTLLVRIHEAYARLSPYQLGLLIAGAFTYSIGAVIYALKWPNLFKSGFGFHELWHLLVLGGYAFHYLMILDFYRAQL